MKYNIRKYREALNLTQQELADKVGCSRQYINELENDGVRNISTKLLCSLATALNVEVDDLLFFPLSLQK